MKNLLKIILKLGFFTGAWILSINFVYAAGFCNVSKDDINPIDELLGENKEEVNFKVKVGDLSKYENIVIKDYSGKPIENSKLSPIETKVKGFTSSVDEFTNAFKEERTGSGPVEFVGEGLGIFMSAEMIKNGVKNHDKGSIVFGSLFLADTIVSPILTDMLTMMIGEAFASVAGAAVGFALSEGFNIYTGVKDDQFLNKIRSSDKDMAKKYREAANSLSNHLSKYKAIVQGDKKAYYQYDLDNSGKILFNLNKASIWSHVAKIAKAGFIPRSEYLNKKHYKLFNNIDSTKELQSALIDKNPENYLDTLMSLRSWMFKWKNAFDVAIPDGMVVPPEGNPFYYIANNRGVKDVSIIEMPLGKMYYGKNGMIEDNHGFPRMVYQNSLWDTLEGSSLFPYYSDLTHWFLDTYAPVLEKVSYESFDNHKKLISEFIKVLKSESDSTKTQEKIMQVYNKTLTEKLSWLFFGDKFLTNVANMHLGENDLAWFARIMLPIIEPFFDARIVKDEAHQLNVINAVSMLIAHKLKTGSNIEAVSENDLRQEFKKDHSSNMGAELKNALIKSLKETKSYIVTMKINKKDLKAVHFNLAPNSPTVADIEKRENNNDYLSNKLNQEISTYIHNVLPYKDTATGNRIERTYFIRLFEAHSILTSKYYESLRNVIHKHSDKIANRKYSNDLLFLEISSMQESINDIYQNYLNTDPYRTNISWLSFNTIPFLNYELKIINEWMNSVLSEIYSRGVADGSISPNHLYAQLMYREKEPKLKWQWKSTKNRNLVVLNNSSFISQLEDSTKYQIIVMGDAASIMTSSDSRICRAVLNGGLHIGTFSQGTCKISWGGRVYQKFSSNKYQVLMGEKDEYVSWLSVSNRKIDLPNNWFGVIGGFNWDYHQPTNTLDDEPLVSLKGNEGREALPICMAKGQDGKIYYGKVHISMCHFPYQNKEIYVSNYWLMIHKKTRF